MKIWIPFFIVLFWDIFVYKLFTLGSGKHSASIQTFFVTIFFNEIFGQLQPFAFLCDFCNKKKCILIIIKLMQQQGKTCNKRKKKVFVEKNLLLCSLPHKINPFFHNIRQFTLFSVQIKRGTSLICFVSHWLSSFIIKDAGLHLDWNWTDVAQKCITTTKN